MSRSNIAQCEMLSNNLPIMAKGLYKTNEVDVLDKDG